MSFRNKIFLILFFSVLAISYSSFSIASSDCVIGYGYATTVMSKENLEHFLLGFEYGLEEGFKNLTPSKGPCQSFKNIKLELVAGNIRKGPLSTVNVAKELATKNVLLLAGFPTSHEALLAARVAQHNGISFVSMGAVANGLAQFSDYVFTTSPKRASYTKEIFKGFTKRHSGQEILVVAKKDHVFSMDIVKSLKEESSKTGAVKITPVYLSDDLTLDKQVIDQIDFSKIKAVYFTLYSSISRLAFLELEKRLKSDATFYVSSSWISHKVEFFDEVSQSTKKRVVAFGAGVPNIENEKLSELKELYVKRFKQKPANEVFEGYEGGVFVANVLNNAIAATQKGMLKSLNETKCIDVYTQFGQICRTAEGYSTKKLYFYHWSPEGYVPNAI